MTAGEIIGQLWQANCVLGADPRGERIISNVVLMGMGEPGRMKGESDIIVTDLPGIYSLSPYTPEEVVSRDYLAGNAVDRKSVV